MNNVRSKITPFIEAKTRPPNSVSPQELRLLVTQCCNFKCTFCHGEGLQSNKHDLLTPSDFAFLFRTSKNLYGINTTTLTGGEPLIRNDVVEIAKLISEESGLVTLTTNGSLLKERSSIGNYISRINVSIHSLDEKKFESIVRRKGAFQKTLEGIISFRKVFPDTPICINSTITADSNGTALDVMRMVDFALSIRANIKFIELYPPDSDHYIPLKKVEEILIENKFEIQPDNNRIVLKKGYTSITMTQIFCAKAKTENNPSLFCSDHNDLFVSPDGKIKPCRHNPFEVDILASVKSRNEALLQEHLNQSFSRLGHNCIFQHSTP